VADDDSGVDRALVVRTQAGDTEAFGQLVNRYMQRAYFGALGLVGNHDDALDLSQEAFVRAFRARATIDPDRPFYVWLYQILRRLCFNHVRDRRTRTTKLQQATPWLRDQARQRASGDNPSRVTERRELSGMVEAALAQLTEVEREVLTLREFEGLRYREIAELLAIPQGTVMSRLYAARRRLAAILQDVER
jgi:RNA polymerase sigma-70 factor, ECF subfamily